jgi:hypothetical protein
MDMIATGAQQIVDMRKTGRQPGSWVLVSFVGNIVVPDNGFNVIAKPEDEYDWRWSIGLDLIAVVRCGVGVAHHLKAIRNEQVNSLSLWDDELKQGAEVHFVFPANHSDAHRRAKLKQLSVELDAWAPWQNNEMLDMGY